LDEAVRLWESGDVEGASRVLESVRFEVERLKGELLGFTLSTLLGLL
jgi:hypothetical protein